MSSWPSVHSILQILKVRCKSKWFSDFFLNNLPFSTLIKWNNYLCLTSLDVFLLFWQVLEIMKLSGFYWFQQIFLFLPIILTMMSYKSILLPTIVASIAALAIMAPLISSAPQSAATALAYTFPADASWWFLDQRDHIKWLPLW